MVALVRGRAALADVVVARNGDHAAVFGVPAMLACPNTSAAVHAQPLAVPDAEDAVELCFAGRVQLLRAPDGGGAQLFVHTGLEDDVVGCQVLWPPTVPGHMCPGRAPVAADEARVFSPAAIALALQHGQAHQDCTPLMKARPSKGVRGLFILQGDVLRAFCGSKSGQGRSL